LILISVEDNPVEKIKMENFILLQSKILGIDSKKMKPLLKTWFIVIPVISIVMIITSYAVNELDNIMYLPEIINIFLIFISIPERSLFIWFWSIASICGSVSFLLISCAVYVINLNKSFEYEKHKNMSRPLFSLFKYYIKVNENQDNIFDKKFFLKKDYRTKGILLTASQDNTSIYICTAPKSKIHGQKTENLRELSIFSIDICNIGDIALSVQICDFYINEEKYNNQRPIICIDLNIVSIKKQLLKLKFHEIFTDVSKCTTNKNCLDFKVISFALITTNIYGEKMKQTIYLNNISNKIEFSSSEAKMFTGEIEYID